ncbi:MAG: DNA repair protein RecO [Chloroherpetonaceae bacterium]|nr:DNA repair protein RecO [Chloroherpetonaceae bacterium]
MIQKCEAIVLRSLDYRDESKIVTLYTKQFGILSAIAKGVRKPGAKMSSVFEPSYSIDAILYRKTTRDLQLISDATVRESFPEISLSLERLKYVMQVLEIVRLSITESDPQIKIFLLLKDFLRAIAQAKKNYQNFFFLFQIKFISELGFKPDFSKSVISGLDLKEILEAGIKSYKLPKLVMITGLGGIALKDEAKANGLNAMEISVQAFKLFDILSKEKFDSLESIIIQPTTAAEIARMLDQYYRTHLQDLPPLRSKDVFGQMSDFI